MLRSLEQTRAKKAWDFINEVKGQNYQKDYRAYVRRAPALILSNGLGNVLAFWRAKKVEAYTKLYEHVNRWFKERHPEEEDILSWIRSDTTSSLEVFKETKEVISLLNWMKRFAEAELEE